MAAFDDYLDLRLAVSEHVGNRAISDVLPRLTQFAETSLNQKIRHRKQITAGILTFENGLALLPADFIQIANVYDESGDAMKAGSLADVRRSGSQYSRYAIDGKAVRVFGLTGEREFEYYAKLPTLTANLSSTNWLLETFPQVYLYAIALEAAKFLRDLDLAQATEALLDRALSDIRIDDERARWSGATVKLQGVTP